jgi:hypothetical protein
MSKTYPIALLAGLAGLLVFANGAGAGVTIDVHFVDYTVESGITIVEGDPGPGCTFTGYYGQTVSTGRCMDVNLTSVYPLVGVNASVGYESDNGLAVASFYEWAGVGIPLPAKAGGKKARSSAQSYCAPMDGVTDDGSRVGNFDCAIPPPNGPPSTMPGTYRLGAIVWDTSGTTAGVEIVSIVNVLVHAVINGNIVDYSSQVVRGSHVVYITTIPEPATAFLLGLDFVGLTLVARRRSF